MTARQRKLVRLTACAALLCGALPMAGAMHIMEGFLPPSMCILWGVIALPFLLAGYFSIKKTVAHDRRSITLIAMAGAFIFVISSLKIPSVTGSCSHMTGTGLGAILFGPSAVSILGVIVLVFQAVLLAAALGDLLTYCVTSVQLAVAYPSATGGVLGSVIEFLGVFAPTQLPLAVLEGVLTVIIMIALESYARPELRAVGFEEA